MIADHAETVGSLLRPDWLLNDRKDLSAGIINEGRQARFKEIENRAVDEAIRLQETAGLAIVTDGEMRRLSFQGQMVEAVNGFGEYDIDAFLWGEWQGDRDVGHWNLERPHTLGVVNKLAPKRYLSVDEFTYLRDRTTRIPKITLPSPSLFANFWSEERSRNIYPTLDSFLADIVRILQSEVAELTRVGATYIQLDAPHYCQLLNPRTRTFYESRGWSMDRWLRKGIELDNAVIDHAPSVTFGFHL